MYCHSECVIKIVMKGTVTNYNDMLKFVAELLLDSLMVYD